jgi:hydroxypyruvate reductase
MNAPDSFQTSSLQQHPQGAAIRRILAAAVQAVEPGEAVRRFVRRTGDMLRVGEERYALQDFHTIHLLGIGKAAAGMAAPLHELLADRLAGRLLVSKHAPPDPLPGLTVLQGGHPLPDERSLDAGERVIDFVSALGPQDLLLCLISGGGSALVAAPVAGVSLTDLQTLTSALLACGARIEEINLLRRRLDRVKGGGILRLANGARVIGLLLSDVVGNPLEAIASGPTVPGDPGPGEAARILKKYRLGAKTPASIRVALQRETDPPGAEAGRVQNVIVGSNLLAAQAALKQAQAEGFHPYLLRTDQQGEARQAAFELATFLRQCRQSGQPVPAPACILAGGETTVTLGVDRPGRGGRNSELALAAAIELAAYPGVMLVTLASDGEDGPTDAAGAAVSGETFARARALGLDAHACLARHDSYAYFDALGDLLRPGPTGTNVNDLTFLFTF